MFDVRSAFNKKRAENNFIRQDAVLDCATNYSGALLMMSLHDKFKFGKIRLQNLAKQFETLSDYECGYIHEWKKKLIEMGVNYNVLEKMSIDLARYICMKKEDRELLQEVANLVAATFIINMYFLTELYRFDGKKLKELIIYIKDEIYVVKKLEVSIMEFLECLNVECDVEYMILNQYKKDNRIKKIAIYGEHGKKWMKYD